ncbi:hypothetical protein BS78_01G201700 [Paspalum vaginatum]|nr:hypothetical protein BS78_01G201700 [Paspalum vaginatum]
MGTEAPSCCPILVIRHACTKYSQKWCIETFSWPWHLRMDRGYGGEPAARSSYVSAPEPGACARGGRDRAPSCPARHLAHHSARALPPAETDDNNSQSPEAAGGRQRTRELAGANSAPDAIHMVHLLLLLYCTVGADGTWPPCVILTWKQPLPLLPGR